MQDSMVLSKQEFIKLFGLATIQNTIKPQRGLVRFNEKFLTGIFIPIGDVGVSTPKRRASTSPMPSSSPDEDIKPKIKQERMDTSASPEDLKKSRTEVADAESNTMHSGKCLLLSSVMLSERVKRL